VQCIEIGKAGLFRNGPKDQQNGFRFQLYGRFRQQASK
jgi:hypothetical protein